MYTIITNKIVYESHRPQYTYIYTYIRFNNLIAVGLHDFHSISMVLFLVAT